MVECQSISLLSMYTTHVLCCAPLGPATPQVPVNIFAFYVHHSRTVLCAPWTCHMSGHHGASASQCLCLSMYTTHVLCCAPLGPATCLVIMVFKEELPELQLEQRLPTISPKKVLFAELPSGESVLYVASDNPASPLEVFLYRGILGYLWFAVEASLPCPVDVHAVTDHDHRHFVIVTSDKRACVLQAQFEGEFAPSKI
ncbi:hypothetical protein J6590_096651 [Homalodisca vitripennis]|nr:hypothetical protein J6590_096651 [Homalodisca vitripennis]